MKMTIKPVALHVIRSVVANMTVPAVAKLNQFIIQHVATSFGKGGLIVLTGPEQPQLYTTNVVDNTEAIANMFSLSMEQRELTQDFLRAGKYKKYVKLMKKFGLPTKYIHVKKDKVKFTDFNTTTVEPATSATPVVAEGDYIALLSHKVQARNPIEEMQLMDEFYTQHGVVYEHP